MSWGARRPQPERWRLRERGNYRNRVLFLYHALAPTTILSVEVRGAEVLELAINGSPVATLEGEEIRPGRVATVFLQAPPVEDEIEVCWLTEGVERPHALAEIVRTRRVAGGREKQ